MSENIRFETITTSEYHELKDFEITFGFTVTKFGHCIVGMNEGRVCYVAFFNEGQENSAIDNLTNEWPKAVLHEDDSKIEAAAKEIFEKGQDNATLNVLLRGTNMQVNVWKQLVSLKVGSTASYEAIAKAIGKPKAVRAVANAIAKNRLAYLVPCHRVIRKTGNNDKYRWGVHRKQKILKYEKEL